MTRKAILIESSDVRGEEDLRGARIDVENWQTFLKSDGGGGWTDKEIVILNKPFSSTVKQELDVSSNCYCFVAYSGHGKDGSVVLNDVFRNCPISTLRPKGSKGTLIIDSCRGVSKAKPLSFSKMQKFANQSRSAIISLNAQKAESMELFEAREILRKSHTADPASLTWMKALKASPSGVVQMYSCSAGEIADEDPDSGGYYTSLLLQSAEQWLGRYSFEDIHTTKDAHDYAFKKLPLRQNPQYSPSSLQFPFAAK